MIVLGTSGLRGTQCIDIVRRAIQIGYRAIDTAQAYGNEEEVGHAIRTSGVAREEISVTTKISSGWQRNPDTVSEAYTSAQTSISRLNVGYVDTFLVHSPGRDKCSRRATWKGLEMLADEGLIRKIGVSNFATEHLAEFREHGFSPLPSTNQIEVRSARNPAVFERLMWICSFIRGVSSADYLTSVNRRT